MPYPPTGNVSIDRLQEPFRSTLLDAIDQHDRRFRIGAGGGWRSHQRQVELRRINGCPDTYSAPASSCRVPTAIPGTSKHEVGLAADLDGDVELAARVLAPLGIVRTVMPREPWHFEPVGSVAGAGGSSSPPTGAGAGDPTDGAGGSSLGKIAAAFRLLADGSTWLRVAQVLLGALAVVVGLAMILRDTIDPRALVAGASTGG